ncbi:MAG: hypothetical protein O3C32_02860 [Bacteroidetes bacterium]|nr:hypothetical protein [Bacteroidota bacterium]
MVGIKIFLSFDPINKPLTILTMKKVLLSMAVVAFLAACGGGAAEEVPAVDSNAVDSSAIVVEEAPGVDTAAADTTAAAEVAPAA